MESEGWKNIEEGGKFYPQKGDEWYYYGKLIIKSTQFIVYYDQVIL